MSVLGIVLGFLIWQRMAQKPVEAPTAPAPLSRIQKSEQIKKMLLQGSRANLPEAKPVVSQSPECASFEKELKTWTVQDIFDGRFELVERSSCYSTEEKALKDLAKSFYENCREPFPKGSDPKSKEFSSCLNSFVTLRALLTSKEYKDIPAHSLSDTKLLIDRLIASFAEMNIVAMRENADRLVELEPDLYDAHKARITARFIESHMGGDQKPDWARLDEYLKELAAFEVTDQEFLDLMTMVKSRAMADKQAVGELIQELAAKPETQAFSKYLEAGNLRAKDAPWTAPMADQAIRLVNQALELKPQEERFKKTLQELEKLKAEIAAGKSPKSFPFSFNFGFHFDVD